MLIFFSVIANLLNDSSLSDIIKKALFSSNNFFGLFDNFFDFVYLRKNGSWNSKINRRENDFYFIQFF
jgi:hypothetical protein